MWNQIFVVILRWVLNEFETQLTHQLDWFKASSPFMNIMYYIESLRFVNCSAIYNQWFVYRRS
jgi:hypothetical protein